jgi:hypothetical protein
MREGRHPATLPEYVRQPPACGFRVYNRRRLQDRKLVAQANAQSSTDRGGDKNSGAETETADTETDSAGSH